jgi:hypothetical protein
MPISIVARRSYLLTLAALFLGLVNTPAKAQAPLPAIPEEYRALIAWTMPDLAARSCILLEGHSGSQAQDYACLASTSLRLTRQKEGLDFSVGLQVEQLSVAPLPGGNTLWPQDVRNNGREVVVRANSQGQPVVDLDAGTHQLTGHWPEQPKQLTVPAIYGPAVLAGHDGTLLKEGQQVWLDKPVEAAPVKGPAVKRELSLQVWRLLEDGQALSLTTRLLIDAAGSPRRITLGPVLPSGFVASSWSSSAPVVIASGGMLYAQIGPGQTEINIIARCTQSCLPVSGVVPASALLRPKAAAPWPIAEVWSVRDLPAYRQVITEGSGIDPAAAAVPEPWRNLPAYRVGKGEGLRIRQVSRGRRPSEGESLNLQRSAWLDGDHWIVSDTISGALPAGGRMAMSSPYVLERAARQAQDMWIALDGDGQRGVTITSNPLLFNAQSVRPRGNAPLSGWQATVDTMTQVIHLPPGQVLLAAPQAKPGSGAWVENLNLLAFFGAAMFALIMRQAVGIRAAIVGAITVILWLSVRDARLILWWLAAAAVFHLIEQGLPGGKLPKAARLFKIICMSFFSVLFVLLAMTQVTLALHPQLEDNYRQSGAPEPVVSNALDSGPAQRFQGNSLNGPAAPAPAVASMDAASTNTASMKEQATEAGALTEVKVNSKNALNTADPLAGLGVGLAGRALPRWNENGGSNGGSLNIGSSYSLEYAGPLRADDTERLWILSTFQLSALRIFGVWGMAWLALALAWKLFALEQRPSPPRVKRLSRLLWLSLLILPCLGVATSAVAAPAQPAVASAPAPSAINAELLAKIRERLQQAPVCAPICATLLAADLQIAENQLLLRYRVGASNKSSWKVPVVSGASSVEIKVNGQSAMFTPDGGIVLALGVNSVEQTLRVEQDRVRVTFDKAPPQASQRLAAPWEGEGVVEGRLPTGAWALERQAKPSASKAAAIPGGDLPAAISAPGFIQVTRTLTLATNVTMQTQVLRTDGGSGGLQVKLPKIKGESALDARAEERGDFWVIDLAEGERSFSFLSKLTPGQDHQLRFPPLSPDVGVQQLEVMTGDIWTLNASGVPEVAPGVGPSIARRFMPIGNEELTLSLLRLPSAKGDTQRIESVLVQTSQGPRDAEHSVTMEMVATQAGQRVITLPPGAVLLDLQRSGQALSVPLTAGKLSLPVVGGSQSFVLRFRTPSRAIWTSSPSIDLGGSASNVSWAFAPPENRWVLGMWGPGWGTTTLYWSQLLVLLTLAFLVSRLARGLFSLREAMLLTLGFSVFNITGLAVLALWRGVVLVRQGARWPSHNSRFNLAQLAMVGLTIIVLMVAVSMVTTGLLGSEPDMLLRHPLSLQLFTWFAPSASVGPLDGPTIFSLPMFVYRTLIFFWAIWFASWLVRSVKQAFFAWTKDEYWCSTKKVSKDVQAPPA